MLFLAGHDTRDGPATRARIMATVEARGALDKSSLAAETGLGWGTVTHHLKVLEREGALELTRHGRRTIVHAPDIPLEQLHWLMVLSRPESQGILQALEGRPGLGPEDLGAETGTTPRTLRRHLAHLEEVGMVRQGSTGRYSTEPGLLERIRTGSLRTWRRIGGRWTRDDLEPACGDEERA